MVTRPVRSLALALTAALALAAFACTSDDPPPTSPLAETPVATTPGVTPTPTPTPTPVATTAPSTPSPVPTSGSPTPTPTRPPARPVPPTPSTPVPVPPSGLESSTAHAIALMAGWLGVAATDLRVERAEEVVWPSRCIGIERPGALCGEALTAGYRVRLLDPAGGVHAVHMRQSGGAEWAGEERVQGAVVAVDITRALLVVELRGFPTDFRLAPGSIRLTDDPDAPGLQEAAFIGSRVELAVDPNPAGEGPAVIAWLADLP